MSREGERDVRSETTSRLTREQVKDSGMALCLLIFLVGAGMHLRWLEWTAMGVLIVDMIWPPIFRPFAIVWFGLAEAIGAVTSRVLLSVLFFVLVTPIGAVRRLMGKDPMMTKRWKRDRESTFQVRDHPYTASDLEPPY
jgi:hypothetical protein